jgi:hypothetical protein
VIAVPVKLHLNHALVYSQSDFEGTCSHISLGKHSQIMFLRTFGSRRPPTGLACQREGGLEGERVGAADGGPGCQRIARCEGDGPRGPRGPRGREDAGAGKRERGESLCLIRPRREGRVFIFFFLFLFSFIFLNLFFL